MFRSLMRGLRTDEGASEGTDESASETTKGLRDEEVLDFRGNM